MTTTDHPHGQADVDRAGAAEAKADGTPTDPARPPIRRLGPAAQAPPVLHDDVGDPVAGSTRSAPAADCSSVTTHQRRAHGAEKPCPPDSRPTRAERRPSKQTIAINHCGAQQMPAIVQNRTVRVRRVYDEPHPDDGTRVIADRP